jgi:tetratricopeptide (TPR) repeat protein
VNDQSIEESEKVIEECNGLPVYYNKKDDIKLELLINIHWCLRDQEKYEQAFDVIKRGLNLIGESSNHAKHQRNLYHGACVCMYHLGEFDRAIAAGECAVMMNRHYDQVYKYLALSHKDKGDIDEAVITMRKAVRYEAPWNERNLELAKELLEQLIQEQQHLLLLSDFSTGESSAGIGL